MSSRKVATVIGLVVAVVWSAAAQAAPVVGGDNVKLKVLDNGLRVVVKEERTWPVVAMGMYIKAGSLHEADDQVGAAHLVEHLLFEAEPAEGEAKVAGYIEGIGGRMVAYTGRDFTHVDITVANSYVETALERLVRTVFEAEFEEAAVVHEQQVVCREIRDTTEGASGTMAFALWDLAFENHPYGRPIGGTVQDVRKLTVARVRDFYNTFYVPNNMSLVVVGGVDTDWLFNRVQQLVANYKAKTIDWTEPARETAQSKVRKHITTRDSEITAVAYAWHAPGMPDKADICATDLIYIILGQKNTGRLHKVLVEENQWASNVNITYLTQQHPGLLVIRAAVLEKNELAVRKAILEQVERLVNEKVTEQELARAKLLLRTEYAFGNESYAGQVMSMGFYEGIDTYEFAIEYIDRVNLVTVDDIQAVARNMFQAGSYSLVILRREKDAPPAQEVKLLCPAAS